MKYESTPFLNPCTGEAFFSEVKTTDIRFQSKNQHMIGLRAPEALEDTTVFVLPSEDGKAGDFLTTNGEGCLSWVTSSETNIDQIMEILDKKESEDLPHIFFWKDALCKQ
jgi:hypothetical protein